MAISLAAALVAPFAAAQSDLDSTARRALTSGETGNPYVTCYTQKEFKGAVQSWAFAEDDRGVLYVGNNIGVLEFDGTSWRRIGVGGGDVVRGLAKGQDGRIYVGSDEEKEIQLGKGDTLLLYTDGVTEAMSPKSEEYSEERPQALLEGEKAGSPRELLDRVFDSVLVFADGAPQSDDITALALTFLGG
ncbi:MAG: serine/threonine-protein phosphatase [Rhodothermales bacterium]|nr:serine/threonine-protein phosphatase [Rhodothermales bacterium]